ncbi:hypothetical protein A3D79_03735 [Candidatus Daviesbacteria bacterium RIFCSPHIGHO2_02_FULL_39_8]|nr:MAG: hypothetical protein A3D79_03735 [Candidatus Daviesbacteria bacterium RIFCSPHIGHO2_02_FULL_39_8]
MVSQTETRSSIAIITAANTAKLAAVEYVNNPSNPQIYWNHQEAHWQFNGQAMGLAQSDLVVSNVGWTETQMTQFMGKNLRGLLTRKHELPFYLPEVVSGPDGLSLLGKIYPWMRWNEGYFAGIQNVDKAGNWIQLFGHLRTEAAIDAPYPKTDEDQAAEILARLGRRGHTINTYAEAANQGKLLTGKYLDEVGTWTRVMQSRARGRVMFACFDPGGNCFFSWPLKPVDARDDLGVRSVGV